MIGPLTFEQAFLTMLDNSDVRWIRTLVAGKSKIPNARHKYLVLDPDSGHLGEWYFDSSGDFITARS